MSNSLKNLLLVLGLATIGYAGYYFYSVRTSTTLDTGTSDVEYQSMLIRTQAFIQRSQELNAMQLDFSVFENPTFTSLQSNTRPLDEVDAGRTNPFAEASGGN